MRHPFGSRTPVARATLLAATLAVLLAPSSFALAADASPQPDAPADVPPTAETVHGWPGTRPGQPAGLYSFPVAPGRKWMHKIPDTWTDDVPNGVELSFSAFDPSDVPEMSRHAMWHGLWDEGPFDQPARVGWVVSTELWLLDVDGTRVAIQLDAFPDADPAILAEARAAIESIVVEPTDSGHRLVFRLLEGWDSG